MTNAKIVEILEHWEYALHCKENITSEEVAQQIIEAMDGWISVDTDLPELNTEVLISLRGCDSGKMIVRTGEHVNEPDHDWESDGYEIANCWDLTHWKPLPSPPES